METTIKKPATTQPTYHGYSIRQILDNLPEKFIKKDWIRGEEIPQQLNKMYKNPKI